MYSPSIKIFNLLKQDLQVRYKESDIYFCETSHSNILQLVLLVLSIALVIFQVEF